MAIKIELEYNNNSTTTDEIMYRRTFSLDYLNVDKEILVSDVEFKRIIKSSRIRLCDEVYDILHNDYVIGDDVHNWVLVVQNVNDYRDEWGNDIEF